MPSTVYILKLNDSRRVGIEELGAFSNMGKAVSAALAHANWYLTQRGLPTTNLKPYVWNPSLATHVVTPSKGHQLTYQAQKYRVR